jgi:hypothetical protein
VDRASQLAASDEGTPAVAQRTTDDQPKALPPALELMPLLVAAVIVHGKAANRIVLLQRTVSGS